MARVEAAGENSLGKKMDMGVSRMSISLTVVSGEENGDVVQDEAKDGEGMLERGERKVSDCLRVHITSIDVDWRESKKTRERRIRVSVSAFKYSSSLIFAVLLSLRILLMSVHTNE